MSDNNLKKEIVETLYWIKEVGLESENTNPKDKYYCPMLNKIFQYKKLKQPQIRTALWIPSTRNVSHLRDVLVGMETETLNLIRVKVAGITATGSGDEEAMITAFTKIRKS